MTLVAFDAPKKVLLLALLLVSFSPSSNDIIKRLQPNYKWAVVLAGIFVYGISHLSDVTEFLYFQF